MARKKNASGPGEKKDIKAILTAPIGGKKSKQVNSEAGGETEDAAMEDAAAEETDSPKKKGKSGKKSAKSKKGKKGASKTLTTYDAIRYQKLKLRQADEIKTFFTRAVLMVAIVAGMFSLLFGFHPQKNNDMSPKVSSGDLLLYYRLDDDFKAQDLVIYEKEGKAYCGRVVARPGDSVDISEEGGLIVNGSQMIEADIFYRTPRYEDSPFSLPLTLSVNQFYVLGDMREGAKDSRNFGPINKNEVKGKVITVLRRSGL